MALVTTNDDSWGPMLTYWTIQAVSQCSMIAASLWSPGSTLVFVCVAALAWPTSYITGIGVWGTLPSSEEWRMDFAGWLVVCIFAAVPLLFAKMLPFKLWLTQALGIHLHTVLAGEVIFMARGVFTGIMPRVYIAIPVLLVLTMSVEVWLAWARREMLLERSSAGLCIYVYTTPLPWVICYTIWNLVVYSPVGIENTLHIAYFWGAMFVCHYATGCERAISASFGFSRAITLAAHCSIRAVCGAMPYFRWLAHKEPAGQGPFQLFLVYLTIVGLVGVLGGQIMALMEGAATPVPNTSRAMVAMEGESLATIPLSGGGAHSGVYPPGEQLIVTMKSGPA